jgi:lipopolysaccharide transport system permease protein
MIRSSNDHGVREHLRIEPRGGFSFRLSELWEFRELIYFLVWRDVKVHYKQAVFGVSWVIVQPLVTMAILALVFGEWAGLKTKSGSVPYPLFCLAAILPWQLFSGGVARAGNSLVSNANLVRKIYFPRSVVPLAAVLVGIVDFVVSLPLLALFMFAYYRLPGTWGLLALPILVGWTLVVALGVGLWLAALNVLYRDVQHAIPFLLQAWLYASPIVYATDLVPAPWNKIIGLNPMTGVIEGFRWALFGIAPTASTVAPSIVIVAFLFVSGTYYFQRMERSFADVV